MLREFFSLTLAFIRCMMAVGQKFPKNLNELKSSNNLIKSHSKYKQALTKINLV